MSTTKDIQAKYVFVDDSDGSLEYDGPEDDWFHVTTETTSFAPETRPPWYNTLHVKLSTDSRAFMSYDFTGTFVSAHFATVDPAHVGSKPITNCTLDGTLLQLVFTSYTAPNPDGGGSATCFPGNESTLGAGSHRLQVFSSETAGWGFDGLFYIPMDFKAAINTTDLVYPIQRNLTMAGETFDFQFNGTRVALYTVYGVGGIDRPVNLSYSIDGGPAINFRSDNITRSDSALTDYLLVQTDSYSFGSHDLHLELSTGNVSMPVLVPLQYAIVQNSGFTEGANLTVVPPTSVASSSSTSVASASPIQSTSSAGVLAKQHRLGSNAAIYISVPLSAMLILISVGAALIRRRWLKRIRLNEHTAPNASGMILPFLDRPSILRFRFDAVDSKNRRQANNRERRTGKQARGVEHPGEQTTGLAAVQSRAPPPTPLPPPPSQMENAAPSSSNVTPAATIAPTQRTYMMPTYMMHEDAGSVRTATPVQEDEVIELPPNYSSILSRHQRISGASDRDNGRRVQADPAAEEKSPEAGESADSYQNHG